MIGDRANLELTKAIIGNGWVPPSPKGHFDLLPIVFESADKEIRMFDIPPGYARYVYVCWGSRARCCRRWWWTCGHLHEGQREQRVGAAAGQPWAPRFLPLLLFCCWRRRMEEAQFTCNTVLLSPLCLVCFSCCPSRSLHVCLPSLLPNEGIVRTNPYPFALLMLHKQKNIATSQHRNKQPSREVPLEHPHHPEFAKLGLKWGAVPSITSEFRLISQIDAMFLKFAEVEWKGVEAGAETGGVDVFVPGPWYVGGRT